MPLPKGYTVDQPAQAPKLPAGYSLDAPSSPDRPAGLPAGVDLPGVAAHPAANLKEPGPTFGGKVLNRLGDNAKGLVNPILNPSSILTGAGWSDPGKAGDLISDIRDNPNSTGIANAIGDTITAGAMGGAMHAAPKLAVPLGENMKAAGGKLIDRTAGLLKKDVARGAEPGRAYLEGGGGPVLNLRGLGESAGRIKSDTGAKLGDAYSNSTAIIPASDVMNAVQEPITKLRNIQNAPGGIGSPAALNDFESNLTQPVYNASNRGGFTPSELFSEMKQPISQNTRWNDPTMYDLNKVRQETVGRLGGLLTDAVPETSRLNKIYQGTSKLEGRAAERAATGQSPLSGIARNLGEIGIGGVLGAATHNPFIAAAPLILDSVPVKTGAAKALFEGGKVVPGIGRGIGRIAPLASSRIGVSSSNDRSKPK